MTVATFEATPMRSLATWLRVELRRYSQKMIAILV
jgi:hypothetical protein